CKRRVTNEAHDVAVQGPLDGLEQCLEGVPRPDLSAEYPQRFLRPVGHRRPPDPQSPPWPQVFASDRLFLWTCRWRGIGLPGEGTPRARSAREGSEAFIRTSGSSERVLSAGRSPCCEGVFRAGSPRPR